MRKTGFVFCGVLLLALGDLSTAMARTMLPYEKATIRLLDKATARVEQADIALNQLYRFGAVQVELRSCQQTPPEEEPESAAFMVVTSLSTEAAQPSLLFRGWMFASNPALSAMEHPLYDVWVIGCKDPVIPPPNTDPAATGAVGTAPAAAAPIAPPAAGVPGFVPTNPNPPPAPPAPPASPALKTPPL